MTASRAWPENSLAADALTLFVVFALFAFGSIVVARQPGTIAAVWFANGAATAIIASAPAHRTVPLLAVVALANLAANLGHGDPLVVSLAFVPGNTLEVALGVLLVRGVASRFVDDVPSFARVLLRGAVVPPLLGALLGSAALALLDFAPFGRVWIDWYVGSLLGSVVSLTLVLSLRARAPGESLVPLWRPLPIASFVATAAFTGLALTRLAFPFVWGAVWLVAIASMLPRLVAFANAFVLVAALAVSLAVGAFVPPLERGPWNDAQLYLSALAMVLPALIAAVTMARQRALNETLAAVGGRSDEIVVLTDMQGVYRWVNRTHAAYWGEPQDAVLGRRWSDTRLGPLPPHPAPLALVAAQAADGGRRLAEVTYPTRGPRLMDVQMEPACDEEGRQIGVLWSARDVTEQEAAQRELQRHVERLRVANESLDQFVHIASHDLREPMNTIEQFCDLIERTQAGRLDADGALYFRQVQEGARRMKTMLDDVLQFVRLEGGEGLRCEVLDLDAVLDDVRHSLQARLARRGGEIVAAAPLGPAWGHRGLVLLALQNLVANGLKFVPPERTPAVRVSVRRDAGAVRIVVADNGIGIEPARLAELGTPFRRLHSRRRFEGTGLGLAICRRIAERHGGGLEIESTPGQGSRFTLRLPDRDGARAARPVTPTAAAASP